MVPMSLIYITTMMVGINLHGCFMYAVLDFIAFRPSFFFIRSLQYNYFTNSMFVISLHHTCEIVYIVIASILNNKKDLKNSI